MWICFYLLLIFDLYLIFLLVIFKGIQDFLKWLIPRYFTSNYAYPRTHTSIFIFDSLRSQARCSFTASKTTHLTRINFGPARTQRGTECTISWKNMHSMALKMVSKNLKIGMKQIHSMTQHENRGFFDVNKFRFYYEISI